VGRRRLWLREGECEVGRREGGCEVGRVRKMSEVEKIGNGGWSGLEPAILDWYGHAV